MLDHIETAEQGRDDSLDRSWLLSGTIWTVSVVALLVIFYDTVAAMVNTWWHSATYQHCFLIPLICAFLVWERRDLFARTAPKPSALALLPFAAAGFLWLLGRLVGALVIEQFALVFMIQASVAAIFGWQVLRALIFPVTFLLFAVPFGDFLIQPLQNVTADMSVWLLQVIGIPTYREGLFISTPSGDFHVAEACSGVRFLVAMVPLGVLFANLSFRSAFRRAAVVALAVIVPIVANGIRAFGIIYIAYLTDNEYAVGVDHLVYGWVFFAFVTIVLIALGMLFADKPIDAPAADFRWLRMPGTLASPSNTAVFGGAVLLLAGAWAAAGARILAEPQNVAIPVFTPPEVSAPWSPAAAGDLPWKPSFPTARAEVAQEYVRETDGARVIFYFAYYPYQRQGSSLIEYTNSFIPGRWTWHGAGRREVTANSTPFTVNDSWIAANRSRRYLWSWYWTGERRTASPYWTKATHLWAMLTRGDDSGAVLAVSTEVGHRREAAADVLADFLTHAEPDLPGMPGWNGAANNE